MRSASLSGVALAALLAGCGLEVQERCLAPLASVTPPSTTLAVGDTLRFVAQVDLPECAPAAARSPDWRWASSDTFVARIDSLSGLAEGVSPGSILIEVVHGQASNVSGSTNLEVVSGN